MYNVVFLLKFLQLELRVHSIHCNTSTSMYPFDICKNCGPELMISWRFSNEDWQISICHFCSLSGTELYPSLDISKQLYRPLVSDSNSVHPSGGNIGAAGSASSRNNSLTGGVSISSGDTAAGAGAGAGSRRTSGYSAQFCAGEFTTMLIAASRWLLVWRHTYAYMTKMTVLVLLYQHKNNFRCVIIVAFCGRTSSMTLSDLFCAVMYQLDAFCACYASLAYHFLHFDIRYLSRVRTVGPPFQGILSLTQFCSIQSRTLEWNGGHSSSPTTVALYACLVRGYVGVPPPYFGQMNPQ